MRAQKPSFSGYSSSIESRVHNEGAAVRDRVLLVEDSRAFAKMLASLIHDEHGFDVLWAENLERTKETLEQESGFFAAIVDFHLPDAPYGEAIDQVVAKQIPTVVFTGKTDKSTEEDLWNKRIADYANKTGSHNIEYVVWMVKRLFLNQSVEVLIVGDSTTARRSVKKLLGRQNFIVHTSTSGEALKTFSDHPNIRVCIIDNQLDSLEGCELTTKLRERHPRARLEIIGISSQGGRNSSANFIKSGASDFILKPLIPEEFLSRINTAVDRIEAYFELEKLNQIKNQFLGTAAHDIRGPLASIKTAADFLLKRSPSKERKETLLKMIQTSSIDLLELLESLLDISAIESGIPNLKPQICNLSEALNERLELYQAEASSKEIGMQTNIECELITVADPIKIKQVFDNLITNAIKYSPQKSDVFISLKRENESIEFRVQDAGPGISENEQGELFKPFSVLSTKATGGEKKTGLGLAITKSILDAHRGNIRYQHSGGIHSTFTVTLPLVKPE